MLYLTCSSNRQQSPLLAGMGFQNQAYHGLFPDKAKKTSSSNRKSEVDLLLDESPAKIDATGSNRILYIQVISSPCLALDGLMDLLLLFTLFSQPLLCSHFGRWNIAQPPSER